MSAATAYTAKRVRRQKQFIAVGSIALLGIIGYQLPKLLHGHSSSSGEVATTVIAPAGPAAPSTPADALPDTDRVVVERDANQLVSFGLFQSKDPFVQQLSTTPSAAAPAPAPAAAAVPVSVTATGQDPATSTTPASPAAPDAAPSTPVSITPVVVPTSTAPTPLTTTPLTTTPVTPPAAPATVSISTNGVCEQVALSGTFPATENIFRLVEIAKNGKSVKIAVAGGSYDSGQPTATAKLGDKLTLVNTSDGARYVIVLQSQCSAAAARPAATTSTPSVTTSVAAPPPAPVTTSSPPIVTDAVDPQPSPVG